MVCFHQGKGLGLYPSALARHDHGAECIFYLLRLCGLEWESALATFPLATVVSTKLAVRQPGTHSHIWEKLL